MKTILITGTRKGIGKFLAQHFLAKGLRVCGCSRGRASIEHPYYAHFELDVSDEAAVVGMVRELKKRFGDVDILINNAGIAAMNHTLTTPYQSVKSIFETNFYGSFLLMREVSKLMARNFKAQQKDTQKGAMPYRIINFTTVASALRLEGEAIYAASKAAIINLTQTCAKELSEFGITVNAVGPTPVRTDLIKNVPQDKIERLLNSQAIKRLGEFEDVLNVVEFFCDEKSDFVTAQVVFLGGVYA